MASFTSEKAYMRFMLEFVDLFGVDPEKMSDPEEKLMTAISDKIWASANVQEHPQPNKYEEYRKLMISYYKGGHFNFEENEGDSFLNVLKDRIGFINDKENLGKDQLAARVSSHFVKFVGEENHVHLAGNQIPETVCGEVLLPEQNGVLIPGIRFDIYKEKHPEKAKLIEPKKMFWIQTENNPDGPDWQSYLIHRTLDFGIYVFRKKLGFKDANVGPYGYGPGDKTPIIIRRPDHF